MTRFCLLELKILVESLMILFCTEFVQDDAVFEKWCLGCMEGIDELL